MQSDIKNKLLELLLKLRANLLLITTLFFIIFLFLAIIYQIDGVGIFSISASILTFIYWIHLEHVDPNGGYGLAATKLQKYFKKVLTPEYLPFVISLLSRIFFYLDKNLDRLDEKQKERLNRNVNNFMQRLIKERAEKNHLEL